MDENSTAAAPQGETEATPTQTSNEQSAPVQNNVDLHGFTSEDLASMRTFIDSNGGWDKIKSRISNPQQQQAEQQTTEDSEQQPAQQPAQQSEQPTSAQPQYQQPPKGYASLQELSVERYFKDLAADPKYANISEQITNGDVLKEMASLGMNPIDENYNINVGQVNKFLELKSASVPTKPTSVEPTNIPTVEYINEGKEITDRNQAFDVLRQSFELKQKGLPPHPDEQKAQEFLKKNVI